MAHLDVESLTPGPEVPPLLAKDMVLLLRKLKRVLRDITGSHMLPSGDFHHPPKGLRPSRDHIRVDYADVWRDTKIVYNRATSGATATHSTNTITLGEFFLREELGDLELKKVVLHEFLHLVVLFPREFHHGQINQIIEFGLRLPPPPNPLGTD